jgi:hypothetical protein
MHGQRISTSGGHFQSKPHGGKGKTIEVEYPPAHPDCRRTLVPVIPDKWEKPEKPWLGG